MESILTKAGCYVAIIALGIFLRRIGFFKKEDFALLSKIVMRITLPAAVIYNAAGRELTVGMLTISAIAIGANFLYILLGWLSAHRKGKSQQAFAILNLPGYNIGNFALPFVQGFFGPTGVITAMLFDVGNACVCLGTSYGIATAVKQGGRFNIKTVLKALGTSVPFIAYVLTTTMNLLRIPFPTPVVELAKIGSNACVFMAMLMLGVGFEINLERSMLGKLVNLLTLRFGLGAILAAVFYFLLPFDLETRQALTLLALSPISTAVPGFTAQLGEDEGLSSALNSISIIVSIVVMTALLIIMQ